MVKQLFGAMVVANSATATVVNLGVPSVTLCTLVRDSAGNRLPTTAVIYSTSDGTVAPLTDITTATGSSAVASLLTSGTTGQNGDSATVTASSGGKSATVDVKSGGNPTGCTLSTDPATVTVGGSSTISAVLTDSSGGPVPDGVFAGVAQVNPGSGANAAILGSPAAMVDGTGTVQVIAAIPGAIALGATSPVTALGGGIAGTSPTVNCTGTVIATGIVEPPTTGGDGDGAIVGDLPSSGFGLVTFGDSIDQLTTALGTSCASGAPIFATSGGAFVGFFLTTSLEAPNAAFKALFTAGIPASTPLLGGNC